MSFYQFNEEGANAASAPQGAIETGVYKATINTASKTIASTGTTGLDWSFDLEDGRKAIVYGFWIFKADGTRIFNADTLDACMGVTGVKSLTEYQKTITVKDGTKTVTALKELDGKEVYVALQNQLDIYNGDVTKKLQIKGFFSKDGKTYSEMVKGSEPKQMAYLQKNLKDSETKAYKAFMAEAEDEAATSSEPATSIL